MEIEKITSKDINEMDYNQLIGLIKETNRPPGGRKTVFEIINRACIDRESNVLEIGTSTGFTAIELSKLVKCKITSIDINEMSLKEAQDRSLQEGFNNIKFIKADVNNLPFKDSEFDLVIVGNVLSLMSNKEKAFGECRRVCKRTGFIAAVPMFYIEKPSDELVKNVSRAIQVNITPLYKKDWDDFFKIPDLEVYWAEKYKFDYADDKIIKGFVEDILDREHLKKLEKDTFETLKRKYTDYMFLFRDNLSKMGFCIILLSNKMIWEDPELYTSFKSD
ncbi:MAG: class I SAM-dependent methyltransferase [Candidatus Pacearchaeota archaeon]|nr:class I SAM-dependent methyltransferase [Candidatus Pacearchaeota archaeon]